MLRNGCPAQSWGQGNGCVLGLGTPVPTLTPARACWKVEQHVLTVCQSLLPLFCHSFSITNLTVLCTPLVLSSGLVTGNQFEFRETLLVASRRKTKIRSDAKFSMKFVSDFCEALLLYLQPPCVCGA